MFVVGGIVFWAAAIIVLLVLLCLVEFERSGFALLVLAGAAGVFGYAWGTIGVVYGFVSANPLLTIACAVAYPLIGIAWAFLKWFLFAKDRKEAFIEFKNNWLNERRKFSPQENSNNAAVAFKDYVIGQNSHRHGEVSQVSLPEPRFYKNKIINWMAYWPFSVLNTLMFDFLRRLFDSIYNSVAGSFRRLASYVYGDSVADFIETAEEEAARLERRAADESARQAEHEARRKAARSNMEFRGGVDVGN